MSPVNETPAGIPPEEWEAAEAADAEYAQQVLDAEAWRLKMENDAAEARKPKAPKPAPKPKTVEERLAEGTIEELEDLLRELKPKLVKAREEANRYSGAEGSTGRHARRAQGLLDLTTATMKALTDAEAREQTGQRGTALLKGLRQRAQAEVESERHRAETDLNLALARLDETAAGLNPIGPGVQRAKEGIDTQKRALVKAFEQTWAPDKMAELVNGLVEARTKHVDEILKTGAASGQPSREVGGLPERLSPNLMKAARRALSGDAYAISVMQDIDTAWRTHPQVAPLVDERLKKTQRQADFERGGGEGPNPLERRA